MARKKIEAEIVFKSEDKEIQQTAKLIQQIKKSGTVKLLPKNLITEVSKIENLFKTILETNKKITEEQKKQILESSKKIRKVTDQVKTTPDQIKLAEKKKTEIKDNKDFNYIKSGASRLSNNTIKTEGKKLDIGDLEGKSDLRRSILVRTDALEKNKDNLSEKELKEYEKLVQLRTIILDREKKQDTEITKIDEYILTLKEKEKKEQEKRIKQTEIEKAKAEQAKAEQDRIRQEEIQKKGKELSTVTPVEKPNGPDKPVTGYTWDTKNEQLKPFQSGVEQYTKVIDEALSVYNKLDPSVQVKVVQFSESLKALNKVFLDDKATPKAIKNAIDSIGRLGSGMITMSRNVETALTGINSTSPTLEALNKRLDELSGSLKEAEEKFYSEGAKKYGKVDKETGRFQMSTAAQNKLVAEKGFKFNGKDISTINALVKRIDSLKNKKDSTPEEQEELKNLSSAYDEIRSKIRTTEQKFTDLYIEVAKVTAAISQVNQQIQEEIKKLPKSNVGGGLISGTVSEKAKIENIIAQEKEKKKQIQVDERQDYGKAPDISHDRGAMGKAVKQVLGYGLAISTLRKTLQMAKTTITELDKALTDQAIVSNLNREEAWKLVGTYQELAKQTGFTTTEIAKVATKYMQQGKTFSETIKLTEVAAKAARVAGIDASQSVNYLTTALNGFKMSADEAMSVSDKFASLAASSATDYQELAVALSKVAAQANLAGMSMDYTLGLLAKGIETTRESAESIGTALKTIVARMRELTDYGATLEEGTTINNVEKQLQYVGIALRDDNGELRSTEDVLDDVGRSWDTFSSNQQAAIAKALAGTRQQSRLIAMMNDYDRTLELVSISSESFGATSAQQAEYMSSLDAAVNKLTTSYQGLITNLVNSDAVVGILNGASWMLDNIISNAWVLYPLIGLITGAIIAQANAKLSDYIITLKQTQAEAQLALSKKQALTVEKAEELATAKRLVTEKEGIVVKTKEKIAWLELVKIRSMANGNTKLQAKAEEMLIQEQGKLITQEADVVKAKAEVTAASVAYNVAVKDELATTAQAQSWLTKLIPLYGVITSVVTLFNIAKRLEAKTTEKVGNESLKAGAKALTGELMALWPLALILAALAAIVAIVIGIVSAIDKANKTTEEARENINALNKSIYELKNTASSIKSLRLEMEELNNIVIKTTEDYEALNESAQKFVDTLSGKQKERAQLLLARGDIEGLIEYANILEQLYKNIATAQSAITAKEVVTINSNDGKKTTWQEYIQTDEAEEERDALKQGAFESGLSLQGWDNLSTEDATDAKKYYQEFFDNADILDLGKEIEEFDLSKRIKSIFDNEELTDDQKDAFEEFRDSNGTDIQSLQDSFKGYEDILNNLINEYLTYESNIGNSYAKLATTEIETLREIEEGSNAVTAAQLIEKLIENTKDETAKQALRERYKGYLAFLNTLNDDTKSALETTGKTKTILDALGENIDDINKKYGTIFSSTNLIEMFAKMSSLTPEEQQGEWARLLSLIMPTGMTKEDAENLSNQLKKAYINYLTNGTTYSLSVQNIKGQFSEKDAIVDAWKNWNDKDAQEQSDFLTEYGQDLFYDEDGVFSEDRYNRFMSGGNITDLLEDALDKTKWIAEAENQLTAAYVAGDPVMIKYWTAMKESIENIGTDSFEDLLARQKEQINIYKEILEQQKDDELEILNEKKEAYEKYFDELQKEYEDLEYEEERTRIIENIGKLGASTDAGSKKQLQNLQDELKNLEKERLKTLREQAQEAVIENIDTQISNLEDCFEKQLTDNAIMQSLASQDLELTKLQYRLLLENQGKTEEEIKSAIEAFETSFNPGVAVSEDLENANLSEIISTFDNFDQADIDSIVEGALREASNNTKIDNSSSTENNNFNLTYNDQSFELNAIQAEVVKKVIWDALNRQGLVKFAK